MSEVAFTRQLGAEALGTGFLLTCIVGSGIMADQFAGGNTALALLGNTAAIGALLAVLITMLGPISGAHFNPAVTVVFALRREITWPRASMFIAVQIAAGIVGVWLTHAMFAQGLWQVGGTTRTGGAQWLSEGVATFGLLTTVLLILKARPSAVPSAVGLYIFSACWFTASTSFANPAVTIARAFTAGFTAIRPADVAPFIAAQLSGALLAWLLCHWLLGSRDAP